VVALVKGVPQTLSLKACLEEFILHRKEVVKRRTEYDLKKAKEREHILVGLKKALDHIDEIIALIKKSSSTADAHAKLMAQFDFSAIQATAILEMKLSRLAALERQKIEDELKEIQKLIKELTAILESEKKMLAIIKDELAEIREKYGDDRKTIIVPNAIGAFNPEDLIAEKEAVLVYTKGGYIKRTDPEEFRTQKRGGVGVVDLDTKEEDFVQMTITGSTHADILFFTDKGRVYQLKMYDIPEGKRATRGKSIMNFLQLTEGEKVASILEVPKNLKTKKGEETSMSVMMITKTGQVKKSAASAFSDVRRSGIIAIRLDDEDELVTTLITDDSDSVLLTSREGQSIRFFESDIRQSGRTAGGVLGMKLGKKGDSVIGADVIKGDEDCKLLVLTSKGYGKMTDITEYKIQNRGGSGIKTVKLTDKTGELVSAKVVHGDNEEILAMSKNSIVIKTTLSSVPTLSRDTQGVKIMSPRDGDEVVSLNVL
jgi:DNA gyrase subunit A